MRHSFQVAALLLVSAVLFVLRVSASRRFVGLYSVQGRVSVCNCFNASRAIIHTTFHSHQTNQIATEAEAVFCYCFSVCWCSFQPERAGERYFSTFVPCYVSLQHPLEISSSPCARGGRQQRFSSTIASTHFKLASIQCLALIIHRRAE